MNKTAICVVEQARENLQKQKEKNAVNKIESIFREIDELNSKIAKLQETKGELTDKIDDIQKNPDGYVENLHKEEIKSYTDGVSLTSIAHPCSPGSFYTCASPGSPLTLSDANQWQ